VRKWAKMREEMDIPGSGFDRAPGRRADLVPAVSPVIYSGPAALVSDCCQPPPPMVTRPLLPVRLYTSRGKLCPRPTQASGSLCVR
jgi:hypothetical protein